VWSLFRVDETCPLLINAGHVVTEPGCPPIAGVGVTCRQRCADGYIRTGGSTSRTCTRQLSWTGTPPVCIAGLLCTNSVEARKVIEYNVNIYSYIFNALNMLI